MDELQTLIDRYLDAQSAYAQNREDKLAFTGFDRTRFIQAEQRTKWCVDDLRKAEEALCLYVVAHREELQHGL